MKQTVSWKSHKIKSWFKGLHWKVPYGVLHTDYRLECAFTNADQSHLCLDLSWKQIGCLRTHMAEGLILPEANQILLLSADGLQWANYPNVSYGTRKTADWSASTEVFAFLFLLTFILKIQRSTIKTGSAIACLSAQADLSFGYKAKD